MLYIYEYRFKVKVKNTYLHKRENKKYKNCDENNRSPHLWTLELKRITRYIFITVIKKTSFINVLNSRNILKQTKSL